MATFLLVLMTAAALILGSIREPSHADRRPSEMWAAARSAGLARCALGVLVVLLVLWLYIAAELFHASRVLGAAVAVACDHAAGWVEAVGRRAVVGVRA
ncbi:hypothetical protein ACFY19_20615 [Streptosporangium saharense]|uniref:hypothetical protein n=1 Tax=Streptosporangium saharense TaxID=1706840 RepID=UPI00369D6032